LKKWEGAILLPLMVHRDTGKYSAMFGLPDRCGTADRRVRDAYFVRDLEYSENLCWQYEQKRNKFFKKGKKIPQIKPEKDFLPCIC